MNRCDGCGRPQFLARLGSMCPASDPSDPGFHQFTGGGGVTLPASPPSGFDDTAYYGSGRKRPQDLVAGCDWVWCSTHDRYEPFSRQERLTLRPDWCRVSTSTCVRFMDCLARVEWMGQGSVDEARADA